MSCAFSSSSRNLCVAGRKTHGLFSRSNSMPQAAPSTATIQQPQQQHKQAAGLRTRRHSYATTTTTLLPQQPQAIATSAQQRRRISLSNIGGGLNHSLLRTVHHNNHQRRHSATIAANLGAQQIPLQTSTTTATKTTSSCPITALGAIARSSANKWLPKFSSSSSDDLLLDTQGASKNDESNQAEVVSHQDRPIPRPKTTLPVIGTLLDFVGKRARFQFPKLYEAHLARFDEHGPIYEETICGNSMIMLSDVHEWVEKVINQEPRYPERMSLEPISRYRNKHNLFIGTSNAVGPEWLDVRKAVNSVALTPASSRAYHQPLSEVARDFVVRLGRIRGPDGVVQSFEDETYKWQLESIFSIFFNDRLGCLDAQLNTQLAQFVRSARRFFVNLQKLMWQPPFLRHIPTQQWREFEADSTALHQQCFSAIESKQMCPIKSLLGRLMQFKNTISYDKLKIAATDLLIGSQESAVKSVQWFLYALARSPDAQTKLQQEIDSVLSSVQTGGGGGGGASNRGSPISLEQLDNSMPYLRACWWETLRMFPPGIGTVRIMPKDKEICGYKVRKGQVLMLSSWAVARNPELFPDPHVFRPERWLDGNQTKHQHLYKQIPFGSGRRMCVGKRIAEQEIFLLTTEIFRRFNVNYDGGSDLVPLVETFLTMNRPLLLSFKDRVPLAETVHM